MKGITSMACKVAAVAVSLGSCSALAPLATPATTGKAVEPLVTRRSAAFAVMGAIFVAPGLASAADELTDAQKAAAEAAKERMRQKIAESKKNYRKASDLVKQRKETTDYSCVADTGSPCPEEKKAE
mmetsp:Transcript_10978/g.25980  ORF Transcript_10978/g.25980 Transcript_10978/m.25980 type:complete len:127 (+) Transcript_10978:94-474(+)